MKQLCQSFIALVLVLFMVISMVPVSVLAAAAVSEEPQETTQGEMTPSPEPVAPSATADNVKEDGQEEAPLTDLNQVPDISEEAPVDNQIVILYEEPQAEGSQRNVENLELTTETVAAGETLGNTVDLIEAQNHGQHHQGGRHRYRG